MDHWPNKKTLFQKMPEDFIIIIHQCCTDQSSYLMDSVGGVECPRCTMPALKSLLLIVSFRLPMPAKHKHPWKDEYDTKYGLKVAGRNEISTRVESASITFGRETVPGTLRQRHAKTKTVQCFTRYKFKASSSCKRSMRRSGWSIFPRRLSYLMVFLE